MIPSTLAALKHLEEKGFTASQAGGIVEQVMEAIANSDLVTKEFLRAELAEFKAELKIETAQLETRILWQMAELDTKLTGQFTERMAGQEVVMTEKMAELKTDLIKWMIGLQFASLGLISTLFGLIAGLFYFLLKY